MVNPKASGLELFGFSGVYLFYWIGIDAHLSANGGVVFEEIIFLRSRIKNFLSVTYVELWIATERRIIRNY